MPGDRPPHDDDSPHDDGSPPDGRHVPVVVVGGGQAGLSISWHLTARGVEHVVMERSTAGHEWVDGRWDAFTLVTPNRQCRLPGQPYAGQDPDGFMPAAEVVAMIAGYAAASGAPLHEGVEVLDVSLREGEGYDVTTSSGTVTADAVVVATGGYHRPRIPTALAALLPAGIVQLHSSRYRSPQQLPGGAVLVVGTGQSGAQITEDLHLAGADVHLAVGGAPRVARRYRGRDCMTWLEQMGVYDRTAPARRGGAAAVEKTNHYVTGRAGGHDLDLRAFARDGAHLHGRALDVDPRRPGVLRLAPTLGASLDAADAVAESIKDDIDAWIAARGLDAPAERRYTPVWAPEDEHDELDLAAAGVTAVVWATGYHPDYSWVQAPVFDGRGRPRQNRGVTACPGLFFLGLPWMTTWGSGRFLGVADDAEHLAGEVVASLEPLAPVAAGAL